MPLSDRFSRRAPRPLNGQVVAVTGGARGIGLALGHALVDEGARVAIGDVDHGAVERAAAQLSGGTIGLPLDVTRRASFAAFLDGAATTLGPVDVLVNNAGVMSVGPFEREDDAWSERQVAVNLMGVVLGCKLALGPMRERGSGHVVNVASVAGKTGVPGEAVYAATKHAVVGLSASLRQELHGSGVALSSVLPGLADTELAAGTKAARGVRTVSPEEVAQAIVATIRRPRAEVYVPRSYGPMMALTGPLPASAREAISRLFGVRQVTAGTSRAQRAAYEDRMAGQVGPR